MAGLSNIVIVFINLFDKRGTVDNCNDPVKTSNVLRDVSVHKNNFLY